MTDLDNILSQIDLRGWLDDQGISYKPAGSTNLKLAECPFCGDTRHKVYFSIAKKQGLCYHGECSKRFNLYSFARQHLATDNKGTAEHFKAYARMAGLSTSARVPAPAPVLAGEWQLPSSVLLPTDDGATHPYLSERRITLETQARFGLRWCEAGVFHFKADDRDLIQDFSKRIIIPVADLDGTIQTFQGRATWQVDEDAGERRYLFPSGLPGTGRFLYGGNLIKSVPNLIINEGPIDVWSTHQAIENHPDFRDWGVIGSFGLSIGQGDANADDQLARIRQLKRDGLKRLVFMWDGERGALLQALEAARLCSNEGLNVNIALLPHTKDPNELSTREIREAAINAEHYDDSLYIQWKLFPPYST